MGTNSKRWIPDTRMSKPMRPDEGKLDPAQPQYFRWTYRLRDMLAYLNNPYTYDDIEPLGAEVRRERRAASASSPNDRWTSFGRFGGPPLSAQEAAKKNDTSIMRQT